MNSLQITSSKSPSSGSKVSTSPAGPEVDALSDQPFACLLAQQIDGAGMPVADTTALATDEVEDPVADSVHQPNDPENILAAIVLAEDRREAAGGAQEADDVEPGSLPSGAFRRLERSATLTEKSRMTENIDGKIVTPKMPFPTGKSGSAEGSVETLAASAMSVAQPNTQLNSRTANTVQTINASLDSNNWSSEFSQKINWMITQRHQVAELHLNPPNLGPLEVVLEISDNHATALFTSAHGVVRDAVENALPKLREMFAENGITLGNATVSDQSPRDRGAQGFPNRDSDTAAQHDMSASHSESPEMASATTRTLSSHRHNGMVDIFA